VLWLDHTMMPGMIIYFVYTSIMALLTAILFTAIAGPKQALQMVLIVMIVYFLLSFIHFLRHMPEIEST
jgi:glycerol-3-phosphate acyltransferase PlsY